MVVQVVEAQPCNAITHRGHEAAETGWRKVVVHLCNHDAADLRGRDACLVNILLGIPGADEVHLVTHSSHQRVCVKRESRAVWRSQDRVLYSTINEAQ